MLDGDKNTTDKELEAKLIEYFKRKGYDPSDQQKDKRQ